MHACRSTLEDPTLADGYLSRGIPGAGADVEGQLATIRASARDAGRDPQAIGVQGLLPVLNKSDEEIRDLARRWQDLGATHLTIDPRGVSLHVNRDLSMTEKLHRRRSAVRDLIANLRRGAELLATA